VLGSILTASYAGYLCRPPPPTASSAIPTARLRFMIVLCRSTLLDFAPRTVRTHALLLLLGLLGPAAFAQDFTRAAGLRFEDPAARTRSGRGWSYSIPAYPAPMLAVLATATHLRQYPPLAFAVAMEGQTRIRGVTYRLFFPRVPPRQAPYVFAVARADLPADRTYFEIPRERYPEFARLYLDFLNELAFDFRQ